MKHTNKKFNTTKVKGGGDYVEVKERIKYLAFDFDGDYTIETSFQYYEERRMWVVKAVLTLIQGESRVSYTGHAQEIESDNYKAVNHTSALENCETSAVGRACAMAGIGVDQSIASANEVVKAINRQEQSPVNNRQVPDTSTKQPPEWPKPNPSEGNHHAISNAPVALKNELINLLNSEFVKDKEKAACLANIGSYTPKEIEEKINVTKNAIAKRKEASTAKA